MRGGIPQRTKVSEQCHQVRDPRTSWDYLLLLPLGYFYCCTEEQSTTWMISTFSLRYTLRLDMDTSFFGATMPAIYIFQICAHQECFTL